MGPCGVWGHAFSSKRALRRQDDLASLVAHRGTQRIFALAIGVGIGRVDIIAAAVERAIQIVLAFPLGCAPIPSLAKCHRAKCEFRDSQA